jgi:hypothetical protein
VGNAIELSRPAIQTCAKCAEALDSTTVSRLQLQQTVITALPLSRSRSPRTLGGCLGQPPVRPASAPVRHNLKRVPNRLADVPRPEDKVAHVPEAALLNCKRDLR